MSASGPRSSSSPAASSSGKGTSHFFAIDRRAWARVCSLGMNPAIAYLVLTRGTGGDQRTTSWSVKAIETYTGISRPRAAAAIAALEDAGCLRVIQSGNRPRRLIVPAHEIVGCQGYHAPVLDSDERKLLERIARGMACVSNARARVLECLVEKGLARVDRSGRIEALSYDAGAAAKPDWIWLPNALVDGVGSEIAAPVELVRMTQNAAALRLLIDLYHQHSLASDGGIHWRSIRSTFKRQVVRRRGPYVVYAFSPGDLSASDDRAFVKPHITGQLETVDGRRRDRGWPVFWGAWHLLDQLGLVEMVGNLVEGDTDEAEVIHPYAVGNGEPAERRLAAAASNAASNLLPTSVAESIDTTEVHLVPLLRHLSEAQMVGIARLRYRPHTAPTRAWFSRMRDWEDLADRYDELAVAALRGEHLPSCNIKGLARDVQHQSGRQRRATSR
jgi:hypothetical protein